MHVYTHNRGSQAWWQSQHVEVEAGRLGMQRYPWLHHDFKASLGYIRSVSAKPLNKVNLLLSIEKDVGLW